MFSSETEKPTIDRRKKVKRMNRGDIHAPSGFGKLVASGVRFMAAGWLALLVTGVACALPSSPTVKPALTRHSSLVSSTELSLLQAGLDDADRGYWQGVRSLLSRLTDPAARQILRWELAKSIDSGVPFSELQTAEREFIGWPGYNDILAAMEASIATSRLTSDDRIAWLTSHGPRTSEGVLALADSYHSMARNDDLNQLIRTTWRKWVMQGDAELRIQAKYGSILTSDDHWARVDMLLWRGRISDAESLLPRLTTGRRKLAEARIAVRRNQRGVDAVVQAVPAEYANDPGLAHERARWRERRGRDQGQLEMLLNIRGVDAPEVAREIIWNEKHSEVRRLLREGQNQMAYLLTLDHGMTDGEGFRDAEWTAGWLALTRLNDAVEAEAHFRRFGDGVTTPISLARANYWLGEALTAQNRKTEAESAYLAAAQYSYVFYGQLAAEKISSIRPDAAMLSLTTPTPPTEVERMAFRQRMDVKAAILLAELGRMSDFEQFSNAIDDTLTTPQEHQLLFEVGESFLHMRAAVRGAKSGLGRGVIAPEAVFPVLALPASTRNGAAEDALVLALTRQESEFYPGAVSSANARGLMQMIPRYAQAEARRVGISFRESWLTDDPTFNLRLGRGFLDELVGLFNGSYVLAAAAYNAGPTRARQWIAEFGDPRLPGVDVVDWIENIPFAETRNYVQRVLENTQVYRSRLSGKPTRIRLSDDLKRGRP